MNCSFTLAADSAYSADEGCFQEQNHGQRIRR